MCHQQRCQHCKQKYGLTRTRATSNKHMGHLTKIFNQVLPVRSFAQRKVKLLRRGYSRHFFNYILEKHLLLLEARYIKQKFIRIGNSLNNNTAALHFSANIIKMRGQPLKCLPLSQLEVETNNTWANNDLTCITLLKRYMIITTGVLKISNKLVNFVL